MVFAMPVTPTYVKQPPGRDNILTSPETTADLRLELAICYTCDPVSFGIQLRNVHKMRICS